MLESVNAHRNGESVGLFPPVYPQGIPSSIFGDSAVIASKQTRSRSAHVLTYMHMHCMYICVCIHIYIYTHAYTRFICRYIYIYIYICRRIHVYTYSIYKSVYLAYRESEKGRERERDIYIRRCQDPSIMWRAVSR